MLSDPTFWVAVAFIGFILLMVYVKVPGMITKALDDRADGICKELEEARRLREEAQALLADYQRKQRDAEQEAEKIIVQAKAEAELLAEETRAKLAETLERRTALAEQKITQAETQAMKEVRIQAADAAIRAASDLIATEYTDDKADAMISDSIGELKTKLN